MEIHPVAVEISLNTTAVSLLQLRENVRESFAIIKITPLARQKTVLDVTQYCNITVGKTRSRRGRKMRKKEQGN